MNDLTRSEEAIAQSDDGLNASVASVAAITQLDAYGAQMTGVRERQEDAFFVHVAAGKRAALLLVADGMGGLANGDAASHAAIEAAAAFLVERVDAYGDSSASAALAAGKTIVLPQNIEAEADKAGAALLVEAFARAQRAVAALAQVGVRGSAPGSTLTALLLLGSRLHIAFVGDTRAYRLQAGALEQISYDHSGASALVAAGLLTAAEARVHPAASQLYRFLGDRDALAVPDLRHMQLAPGDRLLVCSDGLWGPVGDPDLALMLGAEVAPAEVCSTLLDAAAQAGSEDNISAALAYCA